MSSASVSNMKTTAVSKSALREETHIAQLNEKHTDIFSPALGKEITFL